MNERKVKGTMLVNQVRMIRANKDMDWAQFLAPEELAMVSGQILDFAWYPLKLYKHCGWATFQLLGRGNVDLARARGKKRGQELFRSVYGNLVRGQDPLRAIDAFVKMYSLLFNFSTLRFEKAGVKEVRVYHDYDGDDPAGRPYCYQLMGHFDALVEMTGGRNCRIALDGEQWSGAPQTVFDITWE